VTLEPAVVDVRDRAAWVHITLIAVDDGGPGPATGLLPPEVSIRRASAVELNLAPDGSWHGRLLVPKGATPGRLVIDSVRLRDRSEDPTGHVTDYYTDELRSLGGNPEVQVLSVPDRTPPRLIDLRFSASTVSLSGRDPSIRVVAHIKDDPAGVGSASVTVDQANAALALRHGSRHNGLWVGRLRFSAWADTRFAPWAVFFTTQDRAGNSRNLYSDKLAARGLPATVHPVSPRRDRDDPALRRARALPASIDITQGSAIVVIRVRATDAGAGIGTVYVWNHRAKRITGTRKAGVWQASVRFDGCLWSGKDFRLPVSVDDRANNRVTARVPVTVVNHKDIRAPYMGEVQPETAGPTEPVTIRFNEDVVGISDSSAVVRPAYPGAGFGTGTPPAAMRGSWQCAANDGTAVDCAVGPVRHATWTPAAALPVGTTAST
jgi:hypothetical protein